MQVPEELFKHKKLAMRHYFWIILLAFLASGCGQKGNQATTVQNEKASAIEIANEAKVMVYYFHGKQRCKTCLVVQKVAEETIDSKFADNPEVKFVEIDISDKANQALVDKYEIAWSSLVIATNESFQNITDQAFSLAVSNPEALANLLTEETIKLLTD